MGPVSFESLALAVGTRDEAMAAAALLAGAGIRVMSVDGGPPGPADGDGPGFRLVVWSDDAARARRILDDAGHREER